MKGAMGEQRDQQGAYDPSLGETCGALHGGGHDSKRNVENNSEIQATACMQALSFSGTGKRRCVGIV